jgi:hypothetical protein
LIKFVAGYEIPRVVAYRCIMEASVCKHIVQKRNIIQAIEATIEQLMIAPVAVQLEWLLWWVSAALWWSLQLCLRSHACNVHEQNEDFVL